MTDKKEIIIDGVDVLYICKYGQTGLPICVDLEHRYCKLKSTNSKKCNLRPVVEYSNYEKLYKQLQRMTAKSEEYFKQRNNILEECQRYLEEIRELQKSQFCVAYEKDCDKDCKQQNCAIKNSYCYRKALDEIEKMIESIITDCDPITPNYRLNQINDRAYDILDIIRKAKGEEE